MEFDNFTERARGFIQSAQTLALRSNHQQLTPLHLLKCLLEDTDGLADKLINAAGGDAKQVLINTEAELIVRPQQIRQVVRVMEAAFESARTDAAVSFEA